MSDTSYNGEYTAKINGRQYKYRIEENEISDKVIIDGVDVSECAYFVPNDGIFDCNCEMENSLKCLDNPNCYFKQLQRLKAENEKYKQALEDIRECAKTEINEIMRRTDYDGFLALKGIIIKINEVLKDV